MKIIAILDGVLDRSFESVLELNELYKGKSCNYR